VLGLRYDWRNTALLTVHNFAARKRQATIDVGRPDGKVLVDVFGDRHSRAGASGAHELDMEAYGYRWFRVGAGDNALDRTAL
jgi:maltose alpha-D-glucosyltransferase/alpha-amylase